MKLYHALVLFKNNEFIRKLLNPVPNKPVKVILRAYSEHGKARFVFMTKNPKLPWKTEEDGLCIPKTHFTVILEKEIK